MDDQYSGPKMLTYALLLGIAFWALFAALVVGICSVRSHATEPYEYMTAGMHQWESVSAARFPAVAVHVAPLLPPVYYEGQPAQVWVRDTGCEVRLDPVYWTALSDHYRQNVVTHELSHCIGLSHTTIPGILMNPLFYDFSDADGAYARQVWPYPYKVIVCL